MKKSLRKKTIIPGSEVDHALVGRDVRYQDRIWKVVAAYQRSSSAKPWLTLKRGMFEATAKPKEIGLVFD